MAHEDKAKMTNESCNTHEDAGSLFLPQSQFVKPILLYLHDLFRPVKVLISTHTRTMYSSKNGKCPQIIFFKRSNVFERQIKGATNYVFYV